MVVVYIAFACITQRPARQLQRTDKELVYIYPGWVTHRLHNGCLDPCRVARTHKAVKSIRSRTDNDSAEILNLFDLFAPESTDSTSKQAAGFHSLFHFSPPSASTKDCCQPDAALPALQRLLLTRLPLDPNLLLHSSSVHLNAALCLMLLFGIKLLLLTFRIHLMLMQLLLQRTPQR